MDIYNLIHLILKKAKYLVIVPLLAAIIMFMVTINKTKKYTSKASIFTAITSGSSLDNPVENRVDYFATKTAYNNLLAILSSRSVIEETALRLLASHLVLDGPRKDIISKHSYEALQKILPAEVRELTVSNDVEKTYENLKNYMQQDKQNFIYRLLNFDHPHYSDKAILKAQAIQDGSSDIIELSYSCDDPGIACQTLNIMIGVFLKDYKRMKESQTTAVVEYFEQQLQKSSRSLSNAEDRLLEFNKKNNIVNYYEQTKHISSQQEKIEIKLQDILMEYQAARAVLEKLEDETKRRFHINLKNKEIIETRQSLITVNQELAKIEVENLDNKDFSGLQKDLLANRKQLESQLQDKLDSLYIYTHNTEGLDIETLLNDWLSTVIDFESAKARLTAMQAKNEEFKTLYAEYAPLGATLKRIEREIDVKKKEYLEILRHLGLAKLKQQNEEMTASMKLLDNPQLPIDPEPGKRVLLIAIVAVFAFLLTLLGIVAYELLDKTIKTPTRLSQLSGLKAAGAITNAPPSQVINTEHINFKGIKLIIETIALLTEKSIKARSLPIIPFFSNWKGEGKSTLIKLISQQLEESGYKVKMLNFDDRGTHEYFTSLPSKASFRFRTLEELVQPLVMPSTDVVLIEIPALSEQLFNKGLLADTEQGYLVANASRTWSQADDHFLGTLKPLIQHLSGILTMAEPDNMEEITGEIVKERSSFRIFIKRHIFKK